MTDYDLFSRQFKRDPFPTFARLRAEQPVYRHVAPNGLAIWYITRYEDVAAALKDERFVKNLRNAVDEAAVSAVSPTRSVLELINQNMLFADPPYHTRLRALISQAFTPRRVEALAPQVAALADALLDAVAPAGQMDLIDAYAFPLPAGVIMALMGIPQEAQAQVRRWSEAIIAPGSRGISYGQRKRRIQAFVDYIGTLCAARAQAPQDDLLTALVQAEIDGDRLSANELASMAVLLVVTGHETVINLLGNGTLALLRHPEQLALLRANPGADGGCGRGAAALRRAGGDLDHPLGAGGCRLPGTPNSPRRPGARFAGLRRAGRHHLRTG